VKATIQISVDVTTQQELDALMESLRLKFDKTSVVKMIRAMTLPEQGAVLRREGDLLVAKEALSG
jgi:hypothetical protein